MKLYTIIAVHDGSQSFLDGDHQYAVRILDFPNKGDDHLLVNGLTREYAAKIVQTPNIGVFEPTDPMWSQFWRDNLRAAGRLALSRI